MADKFKLKLASQFTSQEDALCAALSEIVLMSRCKQIYAGGSGFSILACLLGDKVREAHSAGWTARDIIDCILNDDEIDDPQSPLPALQRAFAFYMVPYSRNRAAPGPTDRLALGKALQYDPVNAFYALNQASLQIQASDIDGADATLKTAMAADDGATPAQSIMHMVLKRSIVYGREQDRLAIPDCLTQITPHAGRKRPYLTYVLALWLYVQGDIATARRMTIRALAIEPEQPMFKQLLRMCRLPAKTVADELAPLNPQPVPQPDPQTENVRVQASTKGGMTPIEDWPTKTSTHKPSLLRRFSLTIYEALRKLRA